MRRLAIATTAVVALVLLGWWELDHGPRTPSAAEARTAAEVAGRSIFVADCQECHTVVGHETQPRGGGGDLSITNFSLAEEESFAAIMPVHQPLTPVELKDVALYVIERQHRFARRR